MSHTLRMRCPYATVAEQTAAETQVAAAVNNGCKDRVAALFTSGAHAALSV